MRQKFKLTAIDDTRYVPDLKKSLPHPVLIQVSWDFITRDQNKPDHYAMCENPRREQAEDAALTKLL